MIGDQTQIKLSEKNDFINLNHLQFKLKTVNR